jgi:dolichyl-phosphate-mannose--protein O-mannosyl transferase
VALSMWGATAGVATPLLRGAAWRAVVRRDWRYAVVLVGYLAGLLPWMANMDRQMYFFYAVPLAPFLIMAIALILGDILYQPTRPEGRSGATREMDSSERRTLGVLVVCFYLALAITNFAWMFPVLTGIPVSQSTWNMEMWLPSWR